jgi:hypothetical protein
MNRAMILGVAVLLMGAAYAMWNQRQRRLRLREPQVELQTWETEGGRAGHEPEPLEPNAPSQQEPAA